MQHAPQNIKSKLPTQTHLWNPTGKNSAPWCPNSASATWPLATPAFADAEHSPKRKTSPFSHKVFGTRHFIPAPLPKPRLASPIKTRLNQEKDATPIMHRKLSKMLILFAAVSAAITIAVWSGLFTPAAPAAWAQVHPGMKRNEVLQLTGTPSMSGWPEKVVETWQLNGAVCRRRLVIAYAGEQVVSVSDGTWLRGYGWLHPRAESI
jgi:hypothetical protein